MRLPWSVSCVHARARARVRASVSVKETDVSKCSLYTFFTAIPPRLSDPCNFITVLLVTREPEQTTLLF